MFNRLVSVSARHKSDSRTLKHCIRPATARPSRSLVAALSLVDSCSMAIQRLAFFFRLRRRKRSRFVSCF